MRASKTGLRKDLANQRLEIRGVDWGEMHVAREAHHQRNDLAPLFKGLPGNLCTARHWGYVLKGGFLAKYKGGRKERVRAGDVYYLEPGHSVITQPGTELVEFSPQKDLAKIMKVAEKNLEGWLKGKD